MSARAFDIGLICSHNGIILLNPSVRNAIQRPRGGRMVQCNLRTDNLNPAEIKELAALLASAGVSAETLQVVDTIEEADPLDDVCSIFLLTTGTMADAGLEQLLLHAQNCGHRVVMIWPEDAPVQIPPPAVLKYSYSVVAWNSEKLKSLLNQLDSVFLETSNGAPLELPPPDPCAIQ